MIGVKKDAPRRVTVNGAEVWLQEHPIKPKGCVKPLATVFRSSGFQFRQIERVGTVAIFVKNKRPNSTPSYEVVKIRRLPARTLFGVQYPSSEAMPASERWGFEGWTYNVMPQVREKFRSLTEAQDSSALRTHPPERRVQ